MKYNCAVLLAGFVLSSVCLAHSDRSLEIKGDGKIFGLPAEYGPAALHVRFSGAENDPPISEIVFNLGKNRTVLPVCVTGLLQTKSLEDISASASWYHEEDIIPYYLSLDFYDPGYKTKDWTTPGFSMIFNLRTGRLMGMQVNIRRENGRSVQEIPVDYSSRCTAEEIKAFASDGIH